MTGPGTAEATRALLTPDEPRAFEIVNADGSARAVLVCDHASNRIPQRLGTPGLGTDQLANHIAWDTRVTTDIADARFSRRTISDHLGTSLPRCRADIHLRNRHQVTAGEKQSSLELAGSRAREGSLWTIQRRLAMERHLNLV